MPTQKTIKNILVIYEIKLSRLKKLKTNNKESIMRALRSFVPSTITTISVPMMLNVFSFMKSLKYVSMIFCMFRHEEVEDIIDDDKDDPHISDIEDEENCDSENDSEESQDVNEKVECVEGKDATNVLMLNMRRQT